MKRRTFLIGSAAAAGGLALGYRAWSGSFETQARTLVAGRDVSLLAGWVTIGPDDFVTVYVPHAEMGQGVHTALAMILAEELDADWSKVRVERAPAEKAFANRFLAEGWALQGLKVPTFLNGAVGTVFGEAARFINLQITGGSTAVRFTGQGGMRIVGAAARRMLLQAAAHRWSVEIDELEAAASVVSHGRSGRAARYGELAAAAAAVAVPANPPLKARKDYRIVGTSVPRLDLPAKTVGETIFGIDLRLPAMRYAAVTAAPVHGGALASVAPAPAMAVKGVERVVRLPDAVAVIARGYWPARRGLAALTPSFDDGGHGDVSTARLFAAQDRAIAGAESEVVFEQGDAAAALDAAASERIVEATYRVPFLHHAAMEPINATAQFADGRLTVWAGEQDALGAKIELARLSGLSPSRVTLAPMPVGGSFGRRTVQSANYLPQIVEIARQAAPYPVKMIWSREEDFAQGAYRPALTSRLRAALGPEGAPLAWSQLYVFAPSRTEAWRVPYAVPNQSIRSVESPHHVRTGTWRSVNHTQHGFWTESFVDELAHAALRDPFEYRRSLLPAGSRERAVLETAAAKADWGSALPAGVGRGIALVESYGSIVAEVVEAALAPDGRPRVRRVVAAVDCGDVVNPDTATAQVEGAIVMGLSAAIAERVDIEGGAAVQTNFPDYPIMTLATTPDVEVHFVRSDAPLGGLGEPGVPPAAPALANALFAATGRRFRQLPIVAAMAV